MATIEIREWFERTEKNNILRAALGALSILGAVALAFAAATLYTAFMIVTVQVFTEAGAGTEFMDILAFVFALPVVAVWGYATVYITSKISDVDIRPITGATAVSGAVLVIQGIVLQLGYGWFGPL